VYGEVLEDGIQFMAPVELKGLVQVMAPTSKFIGNSKVEQKEPGNMKFSIYQKQLNDLNVEIFLGDYIGYYESEDRVRYYVVSDDGYVKSDNKHTYGGYKPFYRTIIATYVSENEFKGI
jgi:antirestriction protein